MLQGFYCAEKRDPAGLPGAHFTDIHLEIDDPALGSPGVFLSWSYPDGAKASYFEIYQSTHPDSLIHAVHQQPASDSMRAVLSLPDSSRPFTLYFAVRAILIEPTGQKTVGDSLPMDSLTIVPSLNILRPGSGSFQSGRTLEMEVQTSSDIGVVLRIVFFEKVGRAWNGMQDTCLPVDACGSTLFGNSVQRDSLTLEQRAQGDTSQALFCVLGTESFHEQKTGLTQSLGCTRFFRVGP